MGTCKIPYFVYSHSVNGAVFYVGSGGPLRPYTNAGRNSIWHQKVSAVESFDAHILGIFFSRDQTLDFEEKTVRRLRPAANVHWNRQERERELVSSHGGKRSGAGRKRSDKPRCACGAMTVKRAATRRHKC